MDHELSKEVEERRKELAEQLKEPCDCGLGRNCLRIIMARLSVGSGSVTDQQYGFLALMKLVEQEKEKQERLGRIDVILVDLFSKKFGWPVH